MDRGIMLSPEERPDIPKEDLLEGTLKSWSRSIRKNLRILFIRQVRNESSARTN